MVPRSIAVVGASPRHDSLGRFVYTNVMAAGFKGEVYAVNPRHRTIDASSLPAVTDSLAGPRGPRGGRHWGAERSRDHRRSRQEGHPGDAGAVAGPVEDGTRTTPARARGRRARTRGAGPRVRAQLPGVDAAGHRTECQLGEDDGAARCAGTGVPVRRGDDGPARLSRGPRDSGSRRCLATGAESDVSLAEILDYLAGDAATRSILLYVEGIEDARPLLSSIRIAASVKPVIVLKAGDTRPARAW